MLCYYNLISTLGVLGIGSLLPPGRFLQFRTIGKSMSQTTTNRTTLICRSLRRSWIFNVKQELRDLLLGLDEEILEIEQGLLGSIVIDESRCYSCFTTSTGTAYFVDVIFDFFRHGVDYNVLDFVKVESF